MAALRACTNSKKIFAAKAAKSAKKFKSKILEKTLNVALSIPPRLRGSTRSGWIFFVAEDISLFLALLAHPSSGYRKEALAAQRFLGFVLLFR
jgi:hypothetical protein